jgi:hypothetical protein
MVKAIQNATDKATEPTMVKAIQNATDKATEPTMVKAIQNATAKATEPTMVKAIQNATARDVLTNLHKNNTSIVPKQPSNVALHDNATSIEMANRLIDAASKASLNTMGAEDFGFGEGHYTDKTRGGDR